MKKIILSFFIICNTFLYAEDFSSMSTQELIAIMGYVKDSQQVKFLRELQSRVGHMKPNEKKQYKKNLKKYYKK